MPRSGCPGTHQPRISSAAPAGHTTGTSFRAGRESGRIDSMTDLSSDDLAILAAEGCLVDVEAASRAVWDDPAVGGAPPGHELYIPIEDDRSGDADRMRSVINAALRAAGLEPGRPSLDLLAAAIERRGWDWEVAVRGNTLFFTYDGPKDNEKIPRASVRYYRSSRFESQSAKHADSAIALAIA